MVALGPHTAGVMSNDDALANELLSAAQRAGEEMWRLPLPPRLAEQLKSDVADFKNTGERWGGALTAGLFLQEFVGDVPWVHVDIAGPSSASKEHGHVVERRDGLRRRRNPRVPATRRSLNASNSRRNQRKSEPRTKLKRAADALIPHVPHDRVRLP